ncbi:Uncharacterized protein TCM_045065 [Theobroma cacao]|uniref:Uncharacterized protein n=1 Tax=Theobroma cacao TaxID=3641 RepID=A0A061FRR5_THECC|nr:Uncharacterized protein TCM_045065 [Theobroma cacao]
MNKTNDFASNCNALRINDGKVSKQHVSVSCRKKTKILGSTMILSCMCGH